MALAEAPHDHRRHISQRQGQDQQRQQQTDAGKALGGADNADRRQGETEEIGTAVAHENTGGIEVVAQKAQAAAGEGGGQQPGGRLVQAETHREQAHGGDATHAGSQAVEAIEPVDGVGDAHKPDQGGEQTQPIRQLQHQISTPQPAHGELDAADAHPLVPHHDRNRQLAREARQRWQGKQVVRQTDQKKAKRTRQGGPDQLVLFQGEVGEAAKGPGEAQGQAEGDDNAYPTQAHHGRGVLFAGIRSVDQPPAQSEATHHRHHQRREHGGHGEGKQGGRVRAVGEGHRTRPKEAEGRPLGPTLRMYAGIRRAAAHARRHRGESAHTGPPPARGSAVRCRRPRG